MVSGTTAFNDILQPGVLKFFMSTFIHLLKSSRVKGFGGGEVKVRGTTVPKMRRTREEQEYFQIHIL